VIRTLRGIVFEETFRNNATTSAFVLVRCSRFADRRAEMVVMPPREHDLAAENEALRKDIEILQHEVEVLSAKVAELEARLDRIRGAPRCLPPRTRPRAERNDGPPNARRQGKGCRGKACPR